MKRLLFICLILTHVASSFAQSSSEIQVKEVITRMFDGMRNADSALVRSTFDAGMVLQTVANKDAQVSVQTGNVQAFLKSIATPHPEPYDERITFDRISIDGDLASVWTSYKFYIGQTFSHCGVNSFTLVRTGNAWKILHVIDTRRKTSC